MAKAFNGVLLAGLTLAGGAAAAYAQNTSAPSNPTAPESQLGPKKSSSSVDDATMEAQVLLDVAGFPAGVIDGKKGMSFKKAVQGFQESRGLPKTGEIDTATRQALQTGRKATRELKLGPEVFDGPFTNPFPKKAEDQAKQTFLGYRNPLERLAEMFHTTPDTIIALNGPDKQMRQGEVLRLPNVLPRSRSYGGDLKPDYAKWFNALNVDANQPKGDHVTKAGVDYADLIEGLRLPDPTQIAFDSKRLLVVADSGWELAGKNAPRTSGAPIFAIPLGKDCRPLWSCCAVRMMFYRPATNAVSRRATRPRTACSP